MLIPLLLDNKSSVAEQADLSLTWLQTSKTGFLVTFLNYKLRITLYEDSDQPVDSHIVYCFNMYMYKQMVRPHVLPTLVKTLPTGCASEQSDKTLRCQRDEAVGRLLPIDFQAKSQIRFLLYLAL